MVKYKVCSFTRSFYHWYRDKYYLVFLDVHFRHELGRPQTVHSRLSPRPVSVYCLVKGPKIPRQVHQVSRPIASRGYSKNRGFSFVIQKITNKFVQKLNELKIHLIPYPKIPNSFCLSNFTLVFSLPVIQLLVKEHTLHFTIFYLNWKLKTRLTTNSLVFEKKTVILRNRQCCERRNFQS